ncbi:hypothetical protein HPC49_02580 [Pyxidicoccus fallax]|uniref:Uncharacterized protein n=1 Tax=Pyxidicoccus fallax TaxID=394095 RepID=A0A848LDN2_9BACT|nr:hypothetical protein [Pyxidicoccus fallax]NMO14351.1 hypothetical protein [Pyxidicoccus fallax]NPC77140.1 hypothetical protein [Pyxidicoccus fallax]
MSRASTSPFLEMTSVSLKNLALLVFASALILSGCGGDSKPPGPTEPPAPVARRLAFTVQPSQAVTGAALDPAVQVTVQDADGKTVAGAQVTVTLALEANPTGATLSGAAPVRTAQGVATFSGLTLDKAGEGYTLVARADGLESATSQPFGIIPSSARALAFTPEPGELEAGGTFASGVRVTVTDAAGRPVQGHVPVSLALGANPAGGTLTGTLTVDTIDGVALFTELSIDKAGEGYTLVATTPGVAPITSAAFRVKPGPAKSLVFVTGPSSAAVDAHISPAVQVRLVDAYGNTATGSTDAVTVSLAGSLVGTLRGTLTATPVDGVVTFADLSVDMVGIFELGATSPALEGVTSATFDIVPGPAARLAFRGHPSRVSAGDNVAPGVEVTALDARGNIATSFTGVVTVALDANPTSDTLQGTLTTSAVAGVARFDNLSLRRAGTGYTLAVSAQGLTSATSRPFDVTPGEAAALVFTTQPSTIAIDAAFNPTVAITVHDAFGNTVTGHSAPVELALANNPTGVSLTGTVSVTPVNGVASFPGVSVNQVGTGYQLSASTSTTRSTATSAAFNVTAGAPARLVFTTQPSRVSAGDNVAPAVEVTALDARGNIATSFTGVVTVALDANPTSDTLQGTLTTSAVAGVARFGNLSLRRVGTGYTLAVSAQGLTSATSRPFDVTPGEAATLVFTTQPSRVRAGDDVAPEVEVTALDARGNVATSFGGLVTMALASNPTSDTLQGNVAVSAVAGVARFGAMSLRRVGTGYTLSASAQGLTSVTSLPFDVTPGEAATLVFTTQPRTIAFGATFNPAVAVTVRDAFGNTVTGHSTPVELALATHSSGASLTGTVSVTPVNGVASFPGISVNQVGTGYVLSASTPGLTANSSAFNVTAGAPARLEFGVQPSNVVAGVAIAPAVTVRVVDAHGNTVTTATNSIIVAIGNNPGVGILNGTKTVSAVNGVATFSTLSITRSGVGYTLTASVGGNSLTTGVSAPFTVTHGAASALSFYTNAPNVVSAGLPITPAVKVGVRDSYGNTVTSSTAPITLSLSANPGSSTLGGTLTVNAVDGVATFPDLTLNRTGLNYRFAAASQGLTSNTSALFNVVAGPAVRLAFTTQPANVAAGAVMTPSVRVAVQDAFGNTVQTSSVSVLIAIANNPTGAVLTGTSPVTTSNGVATFTNLRLDKVGTGYTLEATASGLTAVTSTAFNVTAGAATQLAFTVQPGNISAGGTFDPVVQVTVRDAGGNTVTTSTASITLALGNNPGGGPLSGTTVVSAAGGVASFPGVSLVRAGSGYTLTASATGLTAATSNTFNVTPGAAHHLAFTVQPSRASVGLALGPVQVSVQDAHGNTRTDAANDITVALGNNPSGATLSGTLTVAATQGVASFGDLVLDARGNGYTLTASTPDLTGATSTAFDAVIAGTRLVYVEPEPGGRIALVSNPASTQTTVVLDVVTLEDLTGYAVGMNLPLDASRVQAGGSLMIPGAVLSPGVNPVAAYGQLPASGPLASVLTTGLSQKAAGEGAVATDTAIPAGSVLYSVQLALRPGADSGVVFDGTALGPKFQALLRDRLGNDVVGRAGFAVGRLEVQ